ncbi:MAG: xylulokinase [Gammaproteobacteria bacterium]|nr:xylulokinase [Gammaproteobacteria bacterium]
MYLGIDVGTQSVKALIYDAQAGRIADIASATLTLVSHADGTREQQAQWWLDALQDCCAQLDPGLRRSVKALAVSGQQHGFVPLDKTGAVLAPVKLWCDTATVTQCEQLTAALGGVEACIAHTGNPVLPGYTAPKILWLQQCHPQRYAALATILLPHDYLNYYLTGEYTMEYGDASGTGLLDVRQRCWNSAVLTAIDSQRELQECLPPLVEPGTTIGSLRTQAASALGLPAGIAVATGSGDNMMAAIGTGSVATGRTTVSLGTSGTIFSYSDRPIIDTGGQVAAFCDATGGWLALVCTMNCTASTELTRALLELEVAQVDAQVQAASPGSDGVLTLPFFNGERTPNLPRASASLFGLTTSNYSAANLLRSAMESSVYSLRAGLDKLHALGARTDSLRLTGGGAGSAVWRQMVADILQMRVSVQTLDEGAALGAALQAMWTQHGGSRSELISLVDSQLKEDPQRCCTPNAAHATLYQDSYANYQRHVQLVRALYE